MAGTTDIQKIISKNNPMATVDEITNGIKATFSAINQLCANGERVIIRDFGTFQMKQRKARTGRNPKSGEPIEIAAKSVLTFKPAK